MAINFIKRICRINHKTYLRAPVVSGKELIKALCNKKGFEIAKQTGSHVKLTKKEKDKTLVVTVPIHPEIAKRTFLSIAKQANMTKDELIEIL